MLTSRTKYQSFQFHRDIFDMKLFSSSVGCKTTIHRRIKKWYINAESIMVPQCTPGSLLPKSSFCNVSPLHLEGSYQPAQSPKLQANEPK